MKSLILVIVHVEGLGAGHRFGENLAVAVGDFHYDGGVGAAGRGLEEVGPLAGGEVGLGDGLASRRSPCHEVEGIIGIILRDRQFFTVLADAYRPVFVIVPDIDQD